MATRVRYIDENGQIKGRKVLLRADFDVSINSNYEIADDARIHRNLPTINYLLKNKNKLICVAKLNRPTSRDPKHSLKVVVARLQEYLPNYKVILVDDFLSPEGKQQIEDQKDNEVIVLENIRFYPGEKINRIPFSKKLASLADVYVNDAFAMSHRVDASVVTVPNYLPAYGGLLLKNEIQMMDKITKNARHPVVVIIGGAKITTKINFIRKLTEIADYILFGGGIANTFLKAQGYQIGQSMYEYEAVEKARRLLYKARKNKCEIILPQDVVVAADLKSDKSKVLKIEDFKNGDKILDIGPESKAEYGAIIAKAKTIVWNGPVGYFENPEFRQGTDFIYYAITHNDEATTIVGGGDTLAAISKKEYLDKLTHISTGGGAMLEYLEKGRLPGLTALEKNNPENKK